MLQAILDFIFGPDYSDSQCIACGSEDLHMLAEDAYECAQCGYEGGAGHADYLAKKKDSALEALDGPAKVARAQRLFEDAHLLLLAARGTLEHAVEVDGGLRRRDATPEYSDAEKDMMAAATDLFQAQRQMQEAAKLRGLTYPAEFEKQLTALERAFDRATGSDFGGIDEFVREATQSRQTVGAMQAWCDAQRDKSW